MPAKRKIEDFDPNKSDSADSTYGASASRPARSRPSKSQRSRPSRKRQRRDYDGSDDISDDEDDISEDSFQEEPRIEEEATDYDDVTGRPKRKAKEKRQTYQEPDSEDDIEDSASEQFVTPKKRKLNPSKIVKLKYTTRATPNPARRSTRARSGSISARPSSGGIHSGTRRSSRIAHDETEPIVALTDSGHHANIVRPGTRSPPSGGPHRPRVGGKGPKKGPATSIVYEEENSSGQTKSELVEDDSLHQLEVAASREDLGEEEEDPQSQPFRSTSLQDAPRSLRDPVSIDDGAVIPESGDEGAQAQEEDDSEDPVSRPRRVTRRTEKIAVEPRGYEGEGSGESVTMRRNLRSAAEKPKTRSSQSWQRRQQ